MAVPVFVILPVGDDPQDIVRGELTVTHIVDGVSNNSTMNVDFGQSEAGPFMSDGNDTPFSASLVYVDDAGLRSDPKEASFTIDTVPPNQPGELGFRVGE